MQEAFVVFNGELHHYGVKPKSRRLDFRHPFGAEQPLKKGFFAVFRDEVRGKDFMRVENFKTGSVAYYEIANYEELQQENPNLAYVYEQNGLYWANLNKDRFRRFTVV